MDTPNEKSRTMTPLSSDLEQLKVACFDALSFAERLALVRRQPLDRRYSEARRARAIEKLKWWHQELNYSPKSILRRRAREFATDRQTVIDLIGASGGELAAIADRAPEWALALEEALEIHTRAERDKESVASASQSQEQVTSWLSPWLSWSKLKLIKRLQRTCLATADPAFRLDVVEISDFLLLGLSSRLRHVSERTFILELNIARAKGIITEVQTSGQIEQFTALICSPENRLRFLSEYPVLARLLTEESMRWLDYCSELVLRLASDWALIRKTFFRNESLTEITAVRLYIGDLHRHGRAVSIIEFSNGKSIVYKPRSLKSDMVLRELLGVLPEHGTDMQSLIPCVLDRGEYGWAEYVSHQTCETDAGLRLFYQRAGALLALMFCLGGVDLHWQNIIAHRDRPIAVDLECLFQPFKYSNADSYIFDYARKSTVLGPGLLPSAPIGGAEGLDLGGFSRVGAEGALSPFPVLWREVSEKGEIRLVHKRVPWKTEATNLPAVVTDDQLQLRFADEIINGFRQSLTLIAKYRSDLLASPFWKSLCGQRHRHVLWSTVNYSKLLINSYHPNVLRNAIDRDFIFDALWERQRMEPEIKNAIVPSERADLWDNCIPIFSFSATRTTLEDSRGQEVWFADTKCPSKAAEARISDIDDHLVERQLWIIRNSHRACYSTTADECQSDWAPEALPSAGLCDNYLHLAKQIADRVLYLSFEQDGRLFWIDSMAIGEEPGKTRSFCEVVGHDVYSGVSGFLLFFHYAHLLLRDRRYDEAAAGITKTLMTALDSHHPGSKVSGGFEGWSSMLYALTHRSAAQESTEITDARNRLLDLIDESSEVNDTRDIIGGAAGKICVLLSHAQIGSAARCLELADRLGRSLVRSAVPQDRGIAWKTIYDDALLNSFSHGTSGIAYSLFRLAVETGKDEYVAAARQAVEFDRSTFSPTHRNWLDLRPWADPARKANSVYWCHGAPGIGLSRAAQIMLGFQDEASYSDLEVAFERTLASRLVTDCLCHGAFGNIDCATFMSAAAGDSVWHGRVNAFTEQTVRRLSCRGPISGYGSETLGLMIGLIGIGMVLLRLAAPNSVPCVLALEGPRGLISSASRTTRGIAETSVSRI